MRIVLIAGMIESLLLLLWRHLLFYAGDARDDSFRPDKLSASLNSVSTSRASPGTAKVERVAASLRGTLERIEESDTVSNRKHDLQASLLMRGQQPDRLHGVPGGGSGNAYRRMLLRRLKELTAGLTGLEVEHEA
jgi:nuclear pore complex protein Nup205